MNESLRFKKWLAVAAMKAGGSHLEVMALVDLTLYYILIHPVS